MWHPEKPVFYVSKIPPDQEYGLVPTSSTDPFYEWCKDPAIFAPLDLSWFPPKWNNVINRLWGSFCLGFWAYNAVESKTSVSAIIQAPTNIF
jgi:hypothetical protein